MKKILCLLVCLAMVFSLTACAGLDVIRETELPPLPTPELKTETPAPVEPSEAPVVQSESVVIPEEDPEGADLGEQILVFFSSTTETEYAPDDEKQPILNFSYSTPQLIMNRNTAAADKINEELRLLDELYYSGYGSDMGKNHLYEVALDHYSYAHGKAEGIETLFSSSRAVDCCRADGSVVSFLYRTSVYTGGSQGEFSYVGRTYSTQTGEKLTLDELSEDYEALRAVIAENIIALAREDKELYTEISKNGIDADTALTALIREDFWYFAADGMVFFPAWGELRPAEEGIPSFTIPYEKLIGVIDDQYLPADRDADGTLIIERVSDVPEGTIKSIGLLTVSDGEDLYLRAEGSVYDVQISSAAYYDVEAGDRFYETERLWFASFMTDCALQLRALLPEGMPDLMITYTDSAYEQHRLLLSENGVDGTPALVDDTIIAVG